MPSNHLTLCHPLLLPPSMNEGAEEQNTPDQPVFYDSSSMSVIRPENLFVGVTEMVNNIFVILFLVVVNTNNRNKRLVQDCKSRPQNSRQQRKSMDWNETDSGWCLIHAGKWLEDISKECRKYKNGDVKKKMLRCIWNREASQGLIRRWLYFCLPLFKMSAVRSGLLLSQGEDSGRVMTSVNSQSLSLCVCLSVHLCVFLSLSLSVSHTHTHTHTHEWVKSLSHVQLFVTPWTVAHQAPLSMGFSRQEYWSGLTFPSPGDLPTRDRTQVSCIVGRCVTIWATREVHTHIHTP